MPLVPPRTVQDRNEVQRVFPLHHADAQEVATTLTEFLEVSRRRATTANSGWCVLMTPAFWDALKQERNEPLPRNEGTRFVADPISNSIIVTVQVADVDDLEEVAELLRRIDVD